MLYRLSSSCLCFLIVVGCYWVYVAAVVPFLEPASIKARPAPDERASSFDPGDRRRDDLRRFADLFPPGAWELEDPKTLDTPQGTLMIKDFQPRDDGSVMLHPCTLVLQTGDERRPIVLQSPEGAVLRFDPPLRLASGKIGRLVGGRLRGEVTIRGPASSEGADDRIEIRTRNLQIEEGRIWTPNDVEFRMGASHGRGRDLSILLGSDDHSARRVDMSGQVRSLRLNKIEMINLFLKGDLFQGRDATEARGGDVVGRHAAAVESESSSRSRPDDSTTELRITCKGPFKFEFRHRLATLEEQVDVIRPHPDGLSDQLNCERLSLFLDAPDDEGEPAEAEAEEAEEDDGSAGMRGLSGMRIRRLVAEGFPVILRAPSMESTLRCKRLEYDHVAGTIVMDDDREVVVHHGPRDLRVAGRRIVLQPDGSHQVLSVLSGATISAADAGRLVAERFDVWLTRVWGVEDGRRKRTWRPERILAQRQVEIDSSKLTGHADRLEVWIRHLPVAPADPAGSARTASTERPRAFDARSTGIDSDDGRALELQGQLVQIQLSQEGRTTNVEDVTVSGAVTLNQSSKDPSDRETLRVSGDSLRILRAERPDMEILVTGRPASARARGLTMVGRDIRVSRATNQLRIDGPGSMTAENRDSRGVELPPSSVTWSGGMLFDGRTAYFSQSVVASGTHRLKSGETLRVTARGDRLDAAVDRRVDFFSERDASEQGELESFTFTGTTMLENVTYQERQLKSWDRMETRNLHVNQLTGEIVSEGSGWLQSVHLGNGLTNDDRRRPSAPNTRTIAGTTTDGPDRSAADDEPKVKFLRVDFDNGMRGNLLDRTLTFSENVRTLYGPVASFEDELRVTRRGDLGRHGVLMTSDHLDVAQTGKLVEENVPVELVARGNVVVEGSRFAARAARISYVHEKDLLILEGDARADARIWLSNDTSPDAIARRLLFSRKNNRVQAGDFRYVDLSRLGGASEESR